MGNVQCRSVAFGAAAAIAAGALLFLWNCSVADDTVVAGLAYDDTAAQAEQPAVARSASQPQATSLLLNEGENNRRIRQALAQAAKLGFNEKPLREAFDEISKQFGIPVWFDERALADVQVNSDTPITINVQNVSLESALRLMLRKMQLTFRVDRGVLQVTSQTENENQLDIRIYPVGELITPLRASHAQADLDFDSLIDVISTTLAPTTWDSVGGPGSMAPQGKNLVISQTPDVHALIEGLVSTLRRVRAEQQKRPGGPGVDITSRNRDKSIEQALSKPIEWEFLEIPLRHAVNFIAKQSGVEVQLDDRALADIQVNSDTPVTGTLSGIPLKDALRLLLRRMQLTYVVDNEVLFITSQTEAENLLQVRVHPISDLIPFVPGDESDTGYDDWDSDSMIDVVTTTVAPTTWDSVGGPGSIQPFEGALALVIAQTQEVHEQIDALFARLREVKLAEKLDPSGAQKAAKGDGLVLRVYALWESDAPSSMVRGVQTTQRPPRGANSTLQNSIGGGFGGAQVLVNLAPPAGVPAENAAVLIRRLVEPETWTAPGVALHAAPSHLVIRQSPAVHRRTKELLEKLGPWREVDEWGLGAEMMGGSRGSTHGTIGGAFQVADPFAPPVSREANADPFGSPPNTATKTPAAAEAKAQKTQPRSAPNLPSAAETRIRVELDRPTEMVFNELPIRDLIGYLKDRHAIELVFDERALADINVNKDTPVTMNVNGISLRSALRLMLSGLAEGAIFVVADDVLLITSREADSQRKLVRIYDVSDFAEPQSILEPEPAVAPGRSGYGRVAYPQAGVHGLVGVIERAIAPGTWNTEQQSAVVPLVRNDAALLVIRHSAGVHEDIVDLLSSLREVQKRARKAER